MVITYKEIFTRLKSVFPDLIDWLPTDREYQTASIGDVIGLMERYHDIVNFYRPYVWECEEIATAFVVDVRREEKDDLSLTRNRAIGEALGDRWNGVDKSHHANIFVADDGIYLFDMQTKKIWPAVKGQDNIFFVRL